MSKKMVRMFGLVSAINLCSKLLGIAKEAAIAAALGVNESADLFVFAAKIPRMLYEIFADGLALQAMLPVLSAYRGEENKLHRKKLESALVAYFLFWIGLIWGLFTLFSPIITAALGMGWFIQWFQSGDSGDFFFKAVILLCKSLPFFVLMTAAASLGVGLQLRKNFLSTTSLPLIVNCTMLTMIFLTPPGTQDMPGWLVLGLIISGSICFVLQLVVVMGTDFNCWRPLWNDSLPGIKKFKRLASSIIVSGIVSQISVFFSMIISSFLAKGTLSLLYFSQKISEVVASALGVGTCTFLLPQLSRAYQRERALKKSGGIPSEKMSDDFFMGLLSGVHLTFLSVVPSMIFLGLMGETLLSLFYRGAFIGEQELRFLRLGFHIYNLGSFSVNLSRVFSTACFARHDARSPFFAGLYAEVVFLLISILALFKGPLMVCFAQVVSSHVRLAYLLLALHFGHGLPSFHRYSGPLVQKTIPVFLISFFSIGFLRDKIAFPLLSYLNQCACLCALGLGFTFLYLFCLLPCFGIRPQIIFFQKKKRENQGSVNK